MDRERAERHLRLLADRALREAAGDRDDRCATKARAALGRVSDVAKVLAAVGLPPHPVRPGVVTPRAGRYPLAALPGW